MLGISPDSPAKLAKFRERTRLTITLLSDADRSVMQAYGAFGEKKLYGKTVEGVIRSTFVVDEEGTIALAQYNVKATGHVAKLRRDLGLDGSGSRDRASRLLDHGTVTAVRHHCDVTMMSLRCRRCRQSTCASARSACSAVPRDLRLLLGAGLVSMTGDWLLSVGLAYSVYALTGSTLASAAALLSAFVPQVLVGSVAGVFVDRWDRKRTMVVANLLLAVGSLPLLLVSGADRIWVVYVVLAGESVRGGVLRAGRAGAPAAASSRTTDLVAANGAERPVHNLARLLGSGLGGVAAAIGGITRRRGRGRRTFLVGGAAGRPDPGRPGGAADEPGRGRHRGGARPARDPGRRVAGGPARHLAHGRS